MKFRLHSIQHASETNEGDEGDEGKTPNKNGIEIFLDCITNIWASEIKKLLLIFMRLSIVVASEFHLTTFRMCLKYKSCVGIIGSGYLCKQHKKNFIAFQNNWNIFLLFIVLFIQHLSSVVFVL